MKKLPFFLTNTFAVILFSSCVNVLEQTTKAPDNLNLSVVANGEDFVRQGFVSKDGWRIDFDRVEVNFTEVIAYQTDPPFNPEESSEIQAQQTVTLLTESKKIDLAEGDDNATPILVSQVNAPVGFYNAIAWKVSKPDQEDATITLQGKATKDNQTVNFVLKFEDGLNYLCGEFVGEERKGFVSEDTPGELEITFHFDHIFGDAETPIDDELNIEGLGFQPLANLAENGVLEINQNTLKTRLSSDDYSKLEKAISSLGHVGEGHCRNEL